MNKDIEKYGDQRAIEGAVIAYRDLNVLDQEIAKRLQTKFQISKKEAEKYLSLIRSMEKQGYTKL